MFLKLQRPEESQPFIVNGDSLVCVLPLPGRDDRCKVLFVDKGTFEVVGSFEYFEILLGVVSPETDAPGPHYDSPEKTKETEDDYPPGTMTIPKVPHDME